MVELVMVSGRIRIAAVGRAPPRGRVWLGGVGRGGSTVGIGRARPGVEVLAAARLDLAWWSRCGALPSSATQSRFSTVVDGRVAADLASWANGLMARRMKKMTSPIGLAAKVEKMPTPASQKDAGNGGRRWVCVVAGGEGLVAAADEGGGEWLGSGWWWCAALLPGGGRSGVGCRDSSSRLLLL
ncbi:hypothetical protein Dimus_005101 [Dionaea muscipula]